MMTDVTKAAPRCGSTRVRLSQKKKWGKRAFVAKMREWGKLGGRPKGSGKKKGGKK